MKLKGYLEAMDERLTQQFGLHVAHALCAGSKRSRRVRSCGAARWRRTNPNLDAALSGRVEILERRLAQIELRLEKKGAAQSRKRHDQGFSTRGSEHVGRRGLGENPFEGSAP